MPLPVSEHAMATAQTKQVLETRVRRHYPQLSKLDSRNSTIRIEAPRCSCSYCIMYDEEQQTAAPPPSSTSPASITQSFVGVIPDGARESRLHERGKPMSAMLSEMQMTVEKRLGLGPDKRRRAALAAVLRAEGEARGI